MLYYFPQICDVQRRVIKFDISFKEFKWQTKLPKYKTTMLTSKLQSRVHPSVPNQSSKAKISSILEVPTALFRTCAPKQCK